MTRRCGILPWVGMPAVSTRRGLAEAEMAKRIPLRRGLRSAAAQGMILRVSFDTFRMVSIVPHHKPMELQLWNRE